MKYEVDINELSKSELYDLLVVRDNKIKKLETTIKTIKRRRQHQTAKLKKYREEITKKQNSLEIKNDIIKEVRELLNKSNISVIEYTGHEDYEYDYISNKVIKILDKENKE